jgi:nitroreductase
MISGQRFKDQFSKTGVADYDAYYALLRFRRSVRGFRNMPVPRHLIEKILEAPRWAPSAGNSQPWEFLVVEKRKTIHELAKLYEYQMQEKKWLESTREKEMRLYVGTRPIEGKAPFRDAHCMIFILADERWGNAFPRPHLARQRTSTHYQQHGERRFCDALRGGNAWPCDTVD